MTKIALGIMSFLLSSISAFANSNPLEGTNFLFVENSSGMYELNLDKNGAGQITTNQGTSLISWTISDDASVITIIPNTDLSTIAFPTQMVNGVSQQVETLNVLKTLTIFVGANTQIIETWEKSPVSNPMDISYSTETISNVKYTNNFTNSFDITVGDTLAIPIVAAGERPNHIVVQLNEASRGTVISKNGVDVPDTFSWSLGNADNELGMGFTGGNYYRFNLVTDGMYSKVIARVATKVFTDNSIYYSSLAKITNPIVLDGAAFAGSYSATTIGIDEIVYDFFPDGTGGFSYVDTEGNSGYTWWAWHVDAPSNEVIAERYYFTNGDGNAMGSVDTKEDVLACQSKKTTCTIFTSRNLKVLSSSGNTSVILRTMTWGQGDDKSTTSDLWTFEKK